MSQLDPSARAGRFWTSRSRAKRVSGFVPFVLRLLAAAALVTVGTACGESSTGPEGSRETTTSAATTQEVEGSGSPQSAVALRVVSGPGGVFAFAEVFIAGKGPFAFTVDTGASRTVLDADLVKRLGVKTIGEPVEITGITCRGEAGRVRVRAWRVGDVRLPAAEIQTVDMPEPPDGTAIDGLLGSDVLSRFGAITVDYQAERLTFARRATSG